jgi:hypothetical protein
MENTKHNGWTNYATWRVNLEIFDGAVAEDFLVYEEDWSEDLDKVAHELASILEEHAEMAIYESSQATEQSGNGLAYDYAMAFINDVNWYEIAGSMLEDYKEEQN